MNLNYKLYQITIWPGLSIEMYWQTQCQLWARFQILTSSMYDQVHKVPYKYHLVIGKGSGLCDVTNPHPLSITGDGSVQSGQSRHPMEG